MKTTLKDETGHRYGRLTVLRRYDVKRPSGVGAYWLCHCDCGSEVVILGAKLRNGNTRSCGCLVEMGKAERERLGFKPYYGRRKNSVDENRQGEVDREPCGSSDC